MRRQIKPTPWACAITALAMTLDIPVAEIIAEAGHDGGEVIFPYLCEPACRKGFHSQELIRIAWRHGFAMTPIELFPSLMASDHMETHKVWEGTETTFWDTFIAIAKVSTGIIEGWGGFCKHAIHCSQGMVYDPDPSGDVYELSLVACEQRNFRPIKMWVFTRHGL